MTDPRHLRVDRLPALEPWALDLLRQDPAESRSEVVPPEELARLVALLRSLPDPEPSSDLAQRVLEYVAEQRARPRFTRSVAAAIRRGSTPGAAFALAAAVAAVFALTVVPSSLPSLLRSGDPAWEIEPLASSSIPIERVAQPNPIHRRSTTPVRPQFVSAVFAQTPAAEPALRWDRAPMEEVFALRLDRQLNQLMIDPTAFAQRLERVAQRDQFIARLAARAAERGDASEIALRVRESSHPLASQLVDRLLRATLVASISPR